MKILLNRPTESVFPAYYDHCTYTEITSLLHDWTEAAVVPLYRGAMYWQFFRPARLIYLRIEDQLARLEKKDWATHYVIVAKK